MPTAEALLQNNPEFPDDVPSLVSKSWELPNQTESVQRLKASFAETLRKLSKYRRLLVPYRRGGDVVMLLLEDWNRIVEEQQILQAKLGRMEDLLEEMEMAPTVLERAKANQRDPKRLMGLEEFMAGVRKERP